MEIAKKKLSENDYNGAKNFINKAQLLYPNLDCLKQVSMMINVYIYASNRGGESDWYKILGVDPLADEEAVKKTYKQLALLLHPDKNKFDGAEGAFKLVSETWCLLSDKIRRASYDQRRKSREACTHIHRASNQQQREKARSRQYASRDSSKSRMLWYKKLALLLHPDKNKPNGSEGAFTRLQKLVMDLQFVTRNVKNECMETNEESDGETQGPVQGDCEKADAWKEFVSRQRRIAQQHSLEKRQRSSSAMLLGLDVLDCPICFEALTIPIFQCDNGHLACSSCCPKLSNKCPTCASPVGHNRCRAMESVLESVFVPCRNAKLGCTKNVSYAKESIHEKECTFTQCSCPVLECSYTGSYDNIYTHFFDNHCHESKSVSFFCGGAVDVQMNIASEKSLVLWKSKKRLLFALQCFNEPHCLYVTVRWIAPSASELGQLAYCLYYSMDGHTLTYKSPEVKRVLEVSSETPQDSFMFVPHSLLRGDSLEMKITIGLKVSASS
ncbi:PREDICTED: E3 ubiquitin-protein ligase SINA-like 7 [Camelina sativa]|uniref:RING-type E3 ubiquitin transferase n=1 Tax=Camelina sativa TaxID=90675 RepID=A0ABM0V700_CAMSA|nr:PREDICTED: E3 ubiquitin-protein ligase SINA-like 7 [Camelina sativa]